MFSGIKMEEFMESEHSGIFQAELVTKNVVLGLSGTHFLHMRVKVVSTVGDTNTEFCFTDSRAASIR